VLDAGRINVVVSSMATRAVVGNVRDRAACGATGGWYYDDNRAPTRVTLCPATCDRTQQELAAGSARIEVQFGCQTVPG